MNRLVIFDLDGTLADTYKSLFDSANEAAVELGYGNIPKGLFDKTIGMPYEPAVELMLSIKDKEKVDEYINSFREIYDRKCTETELYPGVESALRDLRGKGFLTAISTTKPTVYAMKILRHFGIDNLFDVVVGSELEELEKEKPELVKTALDKLRFEGDAIMVGDTVYDVIGARKNGLGALVFLNGMNSRGEFEKSPPDSFFQSYGELINLLEGRK
ncbi:MAG: HAD family hydrolase [Candidatus Diapherotrites archaeon]